MSYSLLQQAATIVGAVELYEFDFGEGVVEYYSSTRKSIFHDWREGEGRVEYKPLPLKRSALKNAGNIAPDTVAIGLPTRPSFMDMLGKGSVSRLQLRIIRGFGDLSQATEGNFQRYWFVGDLSDLSVTRTKTQANLRSLEYLFRETQVPRVIFQGACNNDLFGPGCGLSQSDFSFTFDLEEVDEDGTLVQVNVNPSAQDPSGTQEYLPEHHVQLGDGVVGLDAGFNGIGFYTFGKVWRDSLPEAPRHILAHTYNPTDGAEVCKFKLMAPLPTLETDQDHTVSSDNLLEDSEEPGGPAWTMESGATVELYQAPGPFFATKSALITAAGAGGAAAQTISSAEFLTGVTYTYAFWIKRGDNCVESDVWINAAAGGHQIRIKVEWVVSVQPYLKVSSAVGDFVGATPTLEPVGDEGWYLLSVSLNWLTAYGDMTVRALPDTDAGGVYNKSLLFYAGMVKNGNGLTEYEPNQTIHISASFGCQQSGYACSSAKFDNLDNALLFTEQPSVHPVLTGFRKL